MLLGLVLGLLVAELGHRAYLWTRGRPYDSSALLEEMRIVADPMRAFMEDPGAEAPMAGDAETDLAAEQSEGGWVLHPYSGSEREHDLGDVLRYFREEQDDEAFELLVLGGSVAAALSLDPDGAIQQALAADPRLDGRPVKVLPYAHAAYKQPQQLMRLCYLLGFGYRPDAVLNIDGFNEVALTLAASKKGVNPLYPSPPVWKAPLDLRKAQSRRGLLLLSRATQLGESMDSVLASAVRWAPHSSLLGTLLSRRLVAQSRVREALSADWEAEVSRLHGAEGSQPESQGPMFTEDPVSVVELAVKAWYESSRSIEAICRARDIPYVHMLQPTALLEGSKVFTEQELRVAARHASWEEGARLGFPLLREAGKRLREEGVSFVDMTQCFQGVERTVYRDPCHFNGFGKQQFRGKVVRAFLGAYAPPR